MLDRVTVRKADRARLAEAVEAALREGKGEMLVQIEGQKQPLSFSETRACHGTFPELSPQSFSFNSPLGMCPSCNGLGTRLEVDPALVIPDAKLSIRGGAIAPWATGMARGEGWTFRIADAVAKACKVDLDTPWDKLGAKKQEMVLHGIEGKKISVSWGKEGDASHGTWGMRFSGVIPSLMKRYQAASSDSAREQYKKFMSEMRCAACDGKRLRAETLAVWLGDKSIADVTSMTVRAAVDHINASSRSIGPRRSTSRRASCARSRRGSRSCSTSGSTT